MTGDAPDLPTDGTDVTEELDRTVLNGTPIGIPEADDSAHDQPVVLTAFGQEECYAGDTVRVEARAYGPPAAPHSVSLRRCVTADTELPDEALRYEDGLIEFTAEADLAECANAGGSSYLVLADVRPVGTTTPTEDP